MRKQTQWRRWALLPLALMGCLVVTGGLASLIISAVDEVFCPRGAMAYESCSDPTLQAIEKAFTLIFTAAAAVAAQWTAYLIAPRYQAFVVWAVFLLTSGVAACLPDAGPLADPFLLMLALAAIGAGLASALFLTRRIHALAPVRSGQNT